MDMAAEDDQLFGQLRVVMGHLLVARFRGNRLFPALGEGMGSGGGNPVAVMRRRFPERLAGLNELRPHFFQRITDGRGDLNLRRMEFRLDTLPQRRLRAREDLLLAGTQGACLGIHNLIFFFDAECKIVAHQTAFCGKAAFCCGVSRSRAAPSLRQQIERCPSIPRTLPLPCCRIPS